MRNAAYSPPGTPPAFSTTPGRQTPGSRTDGDRPGARLSAAEESKLAFTIAAGRAAAEELAAGAPPERHPELQTAAQAGREARRLLVESSQSLVWAVAQRYRDTGVPIADLIQDGNLGLLAAVDRFDPELGFRFGTLAWHWIRQTILAGIPRHRRRLRLPPPVVRELRRFRQVRERLEDELGREATVAEVAEAAQAEPGRVVQLEALSLPHSSLDHDVFTAAGPSADELAENAIMADTIRTVVDQLPPRQRLVICKRYGIGSAPQTQAEIGLALGVTAARVHQIERQALERLRRLLGGDRPAGRPNLPARAA